MNGDQVEKEEIEEIIEGVQNEHNVKACGAHIWMARGLIKSLRLHKQSMLLHRWSIAIGLLILLSVWMKEGSPSETSHKITSGIINIVTKHLL